MAKNKIKFNENNAENNNVVIFSTVDVNHWSFLEEIEAPMWADLTLERNMTADDNYDAWFHTSHSFHHLSARQLRSAFAHPDVGNDFVNFNLQGVCSPKLPSSVSKSRGKDYISKPGRNNHTVSVSKNHPVNDLSCKISRADRAPSQDSKFKPIPENQSEVTDSITSVVCSDSSATIISRNTQVLADGRDTNGSANSQSAGTSGVSSSTITTVTQKQDTTFSEVSKEAFVPAGGLLNALRTNLRRSCATRPALRVEVCDDGELKGWKSSSGKSSVGSSCTGYDRRVKRPVTLTETDHLEHAKMEINVNKNSLKTNLQRSCATRPALRVEVCDDGELKGRKSSSGKSSVGSSCTGYDGRVKKSVTLTETDHLEHAKMEINVNMNALKTNLRRSCATRPPLRVEVCDDGELKGRKSSSGKSSVGSSCTGYDGRVKRSVTLTEIDHLEQMKIDINVNPKPRAHKSLIGTTRMSTSKSFLEVKKQPAGYKQNSNKISGVKGPENFVQPMKGRIIADKACEAPAKKLAPGLKQKECKNSNTRDLGKPIPPIKGNAKAQKLVEASAKTRTCYTSRIEGRGTVAASTCPQALKLKVPVLGKGANPPRHGVPAVTGKVGRAHMNGSSCSVIDNKERIALSRISSGNCNLPVLRTIDQKRPTKLSENKGIVASVGSKVKAGRLDDYKLSSEARVYLR